MRIIRKLIGLGIKIAVFMTIPMLCIFCFGVVVGSVKLASKGTQVNPQSVKEDDVAKLVFADNPTLIRQTQGFHSDLIVNGAGGGYDYTTFCGDTLYSPVVGSAVVTYKGLDGVYENNTMITITGNAGTATLLHGDYTMVNVGDTVVGGITPIGVNASNGYSTGCHAHINWKPSSIYVMAGEPLNRNNVQHTGNSGNYGSVLPSYDRVKLSTSHYIPTNGGVNCDSDCSTMASGDKVASWALGRNGIYATACPQEWEFGTRFTLGGQIYECRDRGGFINCYDNGDYDPAIANAHVEGRLMNLPVYATEQYCWVDLLNDSGGFSYGDRVSEWDFVK